MKIRRAVEFKVPTVPNYILVDGSDAKVPVEEFNPAELRSIGKAWTEALIANAERRRTTAVLPISEDRDA